MNIIPHWKLKKIYRKLAYYMTSLLIGDIGFKVHKMYSTEKHGSEYGGFTICPDYLGSNSVVYSIGIGEDITFDLSIIKKYGVTVTAFDPTPKSIAWLKQQELPPQFCFHELGIANYDGNAEFYPPEKEDECSYSMVRKNKVERKAIIVPVCKLKTTMNNWGHKKIDILKMDIEGAEYGVIENLLQEKLDIRMLLVEYHHRFSGIGKLRTRNSLRLLNKNGYKIFFISDNFQEYSFIRQD